MAEAAKLPAHYSNGTEIQLVEDGRFGKTKIWFESKKQGNFYVVAFPDGKTDMLAESALRAVNEAEELAERHSDTEFAIGRELAAQHGVSDDKPKHDMSKPFKLKKRDGSIHSTHDSEKEALHAYSNEKDNKGMKIVKESVEEIDPESLLQEFAVDGLGLDLDPSQMDAYDAQKAYANECPFCAEPDADHSDEEHQAAMNYHTEAAKAGKDLAEKHFHSRLFMKHQAKLKDL
jgi:hypothetical protein